MTVKKRILITPNMKINVTSLLLGILLYLFLALLHTQTFGQQDTIQIYNSNNSPVSFYYAVNLYPDSNRIWIKVRDTLYCLENDKWEMMPILPEGIQAFCIDNSDKLWASSGPGIYKLEDDHFALKYCLNNNQYGVQSRYTFNKLNTLFFVLGGQKLYSLKNDSIELLWNGESEGKKTMAFNICFDANDNLLLSTNIGLFRFIVNGKGEYSLSAVEKLTDYWCYNTVCDLNNNYWCIVNYQNCRSIAKYSDDKWTYFTNPPESLWYKNGDRMTFSFNKVFFYNGYLFTFSGQNSQICWYDGMTWSSCNISVFGLSNVGFQLFMDEKTGSFIYRNQTELVVIPLSVILNSTSIFHWPSEYGAMKNDEEINKQIKEHLPKNTFYDAKNILNYDKSNSILATNEIKNVVTGSDGSVWVLADALYMLKDYKLHKIDSTEYYSNLYLDSLNRPWIKNWRALTVYDGNKITKYQLFLDKHYMYSAIKNSKDVWLLHSDDGIYQFSKGEKTLLLEPIMDKRGNKSVITFFLSNDDKLFVQSSSEFFVVEPNDDGTYDNQKIRSFPATGNIDQHNRMKYFVNRQLSINSTSTGLNEVFYNKNIVCLQSNNILPSSVPAPVKDGEHFDYADNFLLVYRKALFYNDIYLCESSNGLDWQTIKMPFGVGYRVKSACKDIYENIYVGTEKDGLFVFSKSTEQPPKELNYNLFTKNYSSIGNREYGLAFGQPLKYSGLVLNGLGNKDHFVRQINGIMLGISNSVFRTNGIMLGFKNKCGDRCPDDKKTNVGSGIMAGIINTSNGGFINGLETGFINNVECYGLKAGIINGSRCKGISFSLYSFSSCDGIEISLINKGFFCRGFRFGIVNYSKYRLGGGDMSCRGYFGGIHGMQIGLVNVTAESKGLCLGLLNSNEYTSKGLQLGFVNQTGIISGMQLGVVNSSNSTGEKGYIFTGKRNKKTIYKKKFGVQIGLINYNNRLENGIQLGLLNIAKESKWYSHVLPLFRIHLSKSSES